MKVLAKAAFVPVRVPVDETEPRVDTVPVEFVTVPVEDTDAVLAVVPDVVSGDTINCCPVLRGEVPMNALRAEVSLAAFAVAKFPAVVAVEAAVVSDDARAVAASADTLVAAFSASAADCSSK